MVLSNMRTAYTRCIKERMIRKRLEKRVEKMECISHNKTSFKKGMCVIEVFMRIDLGCFEHSNKQEIKFYLSQQIFILLFGLL